MSRDSDFYNEMRMMSHPGYQAAKEKVDRYYEEEKRRNKKIQRDFFNAAEKLVDDLGLTSPATKGGLGIAYFLADLFS